MITQRGMPITGARKPRQSMKSPFVPNAKDTSANEETMINEPPTPFKNKMTAAQVPAPSGASGGISTKLPRIASGLQHSSPGSKALPSGGPVGQRKPINQSAQIGGKMGFPPPSRKVGGADLKSKYPRKSNAAFFGERA